MSKFADRPEYILNGDMSSDIAGGSLDISSIKGFSVQSIITGSPVGDLLFQYSDDGVNWETDTAKTLAVSGAATDFFDIEGVNAKYFRIYWDYTSGTGALNCKYFGKGA